MPVKAQMDYIVACDTCNATLQRPDLEVLAGHPITARFHTPQAALFAALQEHWIITATTVTCPPCQPQAAN